MKEKLSEILLYVVIGEMLAVAIAGGMILENGYECKLLAKSRTCPHCGSRSIDPVKFKDDDCIPWLKHSWL